MKIVSITTIKNEADIIESFIRYHLNIVDLMIILDNGSTDDTRYILDNLVGEGLPIIVIVDKDKYFEPKEKYNFLLKKAVGEHNADIICPLDVDEFITCKNGNPRSIIEKIDPFSYYAVRWKTYVPTENDNLNERFVPKRINHVRDEKLELMNKVIITKEIVNNFNVGLDIGNHHISVDEKFSNKIKCFNNTGLNISHFPLRSINQTMSKVMISYPNTLSRKKVKKGMSHHYTIMFNKIKQFGTIDFSDVTEFAKQYSLKQNKGRDDFDENIVISIKKDPVNLAFCQNIEIKYDFNENPLSNVLENYVYFAVEINKFKNEITGLNEKISSLENEMISLNNVNSENINKIHEMDEIINKYVEYIEMKEHENIIAVNNESLVLDDFKQRYINQTNRLVSDKYYYDKQHRMDLNKIKYFESLNKKQDNFLTYLQILFHSKFRDALINIKLYNLLKKDNLFDLDFYLNMYPEVLENKLCKNFSAEFHYVCVGFDEGRLFKSNVSNINDKRSLLKYLEMC